MKRMILAKGMGAALALVLTAGLAGQASAGLREYCASYARDVAHRKTNGGADVSVGTNGGLTSHKGTGTGVITGGAVIGAGVTSDRYKRAYANAYDRCVANYEGTSEPDAAAQAEPAGQKVPDKSDKKVVAASEAPDKKVVGSEATQKKVAASEPTEKVAASEPREKKMAASETTEKKVAASEPTKKKVAVSDALDKDKACARKYRSYDPQVGKYKSYTGKWRACRLSRG
jgi:hypothetical protein